MKKYNLKEIQAVSSTLDELAAAISQGEGNNLKEDTITDFFAEQKFSKKAMGWLSGYTHSKLQWVMKEYFEEILKAKKVKMSKLDYDSESQPVMADIECDLRKTFKVIDDASIFYILPDGKKIVVTISNDRDESTRHYMIYASSHDHNVAEQVTEQLTDIISKKWTELANEKNFYKGKKISCEGRFLDLSEVSWDDVIIPKKTLEVINNNVSNVLKDYEYLRKFSVPVKRGIILHGAPGTGKTQICRAIAKNAECSVLYALPKDFAPNRGGVQAVCNMAKDIAPCILIIEDIDWIAQDRHEGNAGFIIELMNALDGIESFGDIITVGTTNHQDEIESAVKNRPGRFDRIIKIGKPTEQNRVKMLKAFTKTYLLDKDVDIESLSGLLENLSGAHIKDFCITAALFAVREKSFTAKEENLLIKNSHFQNALIEIKNKDFSSYQQVQQSENKVMGFNRTPSVESLL